MKYPPIRFALIGCGRIAKNHVSPLIESDGASLVALCDLVEERARKYGNSSIPIYTNYHEMLKNEEIDVVSVLTPSGMHPQHVLDIIGNYGKHVAVEKPMALCWNDISRMREAAAANNVKIFPVYQNRYNRAVCKVRDDVNNDTLGKVALATIRLRWCRGQSYYSRDPWRGTWAMDGGALTNQGIHYIDLLQHIVGPIASVNCVTATQLVNVEVEDTAIATVKFHSGALGVIEITTAARPDDFEASISVLGERGTAILTGIACNTLSTYTIDPAACALNSEEFPDAYGFGHWPFFRDIVEDLRGIRAHPISFDEGTRAIQLLNALYRSAEEHREVSLSEGISSKLLGRRDPKLEALYTTRL